MRVDTRGTLCPYPVIALGRAAQELKGGRITLLADDPVALTDVPAWCRMRSATLLDVLEHDGYWEFLVLTAPAGD